MDLFILVNVSLKLKIEIKFLFIQNSYEKSDSAFKSKYENILSSRKIFSNLRLANSELKNRLYKWIVKNNNLKSILKLNILFNSFKLTFKLGLRSKSLTVRVIF